MLIRYVSRLRGSRVVHSVLASLLGALIGVAASSFWVYPRAAGAERSAVVRCTGLEIVDHTGARIGYLGASRRTRSGSLVFFDSAGAKRLEIGFIDDSPKLSFSNTRGNELMTMTLLEDAKPKLLMRDGNRLDRVLLGVNEPDARGPGEPAKAWVLQFRGDREPLASIGMRPEQTGGIAVRDTEGHEWRAPLGK